MKKTRIKQDGYHHGDLRNALLLSALEVATEQGARSLSLREVSRRASVTHAAAYRHFASKEALLAELATEGMLELHARTRDAVLTTPGTALDKLARAGEAYVTFGAKNPEQLQIMFGDLLPDWQPYPKLRDAAESAFLVLLEVVKEGQTTGQIRGDDPKEVALVAWAQMHGLALLVSGGKIPRTVRENRSDQDLALLGARLLQLGLEK